MMVKSMRINSMKNIKNIVYYLNKIIPLDMEIIIKKKTKSLTNTNKIMPSYDESMIEKIYKNGGL
tara:strand:+ start:1183 stop:1377 length:195 start_codon:yes stop_codon:yes gene_type:complete